MAHEKVGGSVHAKEGGVYIRRCTSVHQKEVGGWGGGGCTEEGGWTCVSVCQKKGLGVHQERQAGRQAEAKKGL